MKKHKLVSVLFIILVVAIVVLFSERILIQTVDAEDVTVKSIAVQGENLVITFEVDNPDKHFEYIGGGWGNAIFDGEKVIQCLMYKKIKLSHESDNYCWSSSIPLKSAEQMAVFYGTEKNNILIYENGETKY